MVIIIILTLAACSNQKSNIVGVNSGGEKQALDQTGKEVLAENNNNERLACKQAQKSRSPIQEKGCSATAQVEASEDRAKENLADRKLKEARSTTLVVDKR